MSGKEWKDLHIYCILGITAAQVASFALSYLVSFRE